MRLRRNGYGEILPRMRCKKARPAACSWQLEMRLRRSGRGEILPRVRQSQACPRGQLEMHLRQCEYRQILPGMWCQKTCLPLRQMRMGACGSHASAQVLPGVRRPF